MLKFTKMQGTGNDYIFLNAAAAGVKNPEKLTREICDRHYGVGADGLILIMKSAGADFRMRIFNADGSEAEMCGNGIRCFAKYVYDHGMTDKKNITIETLSGLKRLELFTKNKKVSTVRVDMGEPILQRERIPMIGEPGMVIDEILSLDDGIKFNITSLSMGNPHVVIFVEDIENFPVSKYGPVLENHSLFPQRTNVEFVRIVNENEIVQRTWERGSGETLSCGTGASAATTACILNKKTGRNLLVHLKGGDLQTEWNESDNRIYLTGPAVEVFEGIWRD
ncbi:MAG: diaminopimelate epimerase [Spirochaetes bacterium]|jgi:diaminopimelate epimerase|nr:diaminopimelate epimerase [Spirochaetota bacterium]